MMEYNMMFPNVGPDDLETYKRKTSTISDIVLKEIMDIVPQDNSENSSSMQTSSHDEDDEVEGEIIVKGVKFIENDTNIDIDTCSVYDEIDQGKIEDDMEMCSIFDQNDQEPNLLFLKRNRRRGNVLRNAKDSLILSHNEVNDIDSIMAKKPEPEPVPQDIIDVIKLRLKRLYLAFQPPNICEGPTDVIITVRKNVDGQETKRVLAHSKVLRRCCNVFREMLDSYADSMELRTNHEIHLQTTFDEISTEVGTRVIPNYVECFIHPKYIIPTPIVRKKSSIQCNKTIFSLPVDHEEENETESTPTRTAEEISMYRIADWSELEHMRSLERVVEENKFSDVSLNDLNILKEDKQKDIEKNKNDIRIEERNPQQKTEELVKLGQSLLENLTTIHLPKNTKENYDNFANLLYSHLERVKEKDGSRLIQEQHSNQAIEGHINIAQNENQTDMKRGKMMNDEVMVGTLSTGMPQISNENKKDSEQKSQLRTSKLVVYAAPPEQEVGINVDGGSFRRRSVAPMNANTENVARKSIVPAESTKKESIMLETIAQGTSIRENVIATSSLAKGSHISRAGSFFGNNKQVDRPSISMETQLDLCLQIVPHHELAMIQHKLLKKQEKQTTKYEEDFVVTSDKQKQKALRHEDIPKRPYIYRIIKGEWTSAALDAIMEFIYTERCHVPVEEIWQVWKAANDVLLVTLTDLITQHPLLEYLRLALKTELNRRSLLQLCSIADSVRTPDIKKLRTFCELFEYDGLLERLPYTFTLRTAHVAYRKSEFVEEGMHIYPRVKACVLRVLPPEKRLFEEDAQQVQYITFTKKESDQTGLRARIKPHWLGRKTPEPFLDNNEDRAWTVTVFGPKIAEECYHFYKHMVGTTLRAMEPETFSLHLVTPFLKLPVIQQAIRKSFDPSELHVKANRGTSFYIGGETHGASITLSGEPRLILAATKAIPKDIMVGRTSLRFGQPSMETFVNFFSVTQTFGIDLEKDAVYLIKNLKKLKRALQYFVDLSTDAFIPWNLPREMVEIVVPCDAF